VHITISSKKPKHLFKNYSTLPEVNLNIINQFGYLFVASFIFIFSQSFTKLTYLPYEVCLSRDLPAFVMYVAQRFILQFHQTKSGTTSVRKPLLSCIKLHFPNSGTVCNGQKQGFQNVITALAYCQALL
jgi:hypothetical protein